MKELVGEEREIHTGALASVLRESWKNCEVPSLENEPVIESEKTLLNLEKAGNGSNTEVTAGCAESKTPIVIEENTMSVDVSKTGDTESSLIKIDDIDVKKEELENGKRFLIFTTAEDSFLKEGFVK